MKPSTSLIAAALALCRQVTAQDTLATQCYFKSDENLLTSFSHPCVIVTADSNFLSCCEVSDTCLESGVCHYTRATPATPSVVSRYYVGGCTDLSFSSPACQQACSDLDPTDIVYNQTANRWNCCGETNGTIHYDAPTDESFSAQAPSATYTVPNMVVTRAAGMYVYEKIMKMGPGRLCILDRKIWIGFTLTEKREFGVE